MPRPSTRSATSAAALGAGAAPAAMPMRLAADGMGDGASKALMAKLASAVGELKALKVQPLLQRAIAGLNAGDFKVGAEFAIRALEEDERSGVGWYLLAVAREQAGDFAASIKCYESALALLPDHGEITNNLGRLAYRLGQKEVAEKLFRLYVARFPADVEGANNLACVLRDQQRYGEAIETLKAAIGAAPEHPMLWNTLGTTLAEQGDPLNAEIFFNEAVRLDGGFAKARYNRGNIRLLQGDIDSAIIDCERAMAGPMPRDEQIMMHLAHSTMLLNLQRLGEGWDEYDVRLDPAFADCTHVVVDRPRWTPEADLAGRSLLVVGEQGLGDEVMFANVLPDVIQSLGPNGRLTLAVEPRLIPLFQRAYPQARVGAHATYQTEGRSFRLLPFLSEDDVAGLDLWTPVGSLLRRFRRDLDAFPANARFLTPDPQRVAHWREVLQRAPVGRKVGLLWKSNSALGARHRYYSPFDGWAPVLATPGVTFVNLQYGDCAAEIAQARETLGVEIWEPPGIDLKQDLDDVAALTCALDLVVGFPNATSNIGAACGASAWLISNLGAWPRLGTDRYPWYPQMQVFVPTTFGEWDDVMQDVAKAMAAFAAD